MRAKAIKNKAKINAELSPAELKQLLKKAQSQVTTFESYVTNVESELQQWRNGEPVPRERWTPSLSKEPAAATRERLPATPHRLQSSDGRRSETPSRPDSRMDLERAATPSIALEKDEKEEFLRRENELQDQLAEKESQFVKMEQSLKEAKEELQVLKEHDTRTNKDNEYLTSELNDFRMQVEKISFEAKESMITMDSFKEANSELTAELDEVKQQLLDAKMNAKESGAFTDEKEKKKTERMAQMMAGFDLGGESFSDNERAIRQVIDQVDNLHDMIASGEDVVPDDLRHIRQRLLETQGIVRQAELSVNERSEQHEAHQLRRSELEQRIADLQREHEAVLEGKLSNADIEEVKSRLAQAYDSKQNGEVEIVQELKEDLLQKSDENQRLHGEIQSLESRIKNGAIAINGAGTNGKTVQQQIAEFDNMKKSLMRDLQNRCERVSVQFRSMVA